MTHLLVLSLHSNVCNCLYLLGDSVGQSHFLSTDRYGWETLRSLHQVLSRTICMLSKYSMGSHPKPNARWCFTQSNHHQQSTIVVTHLFFKVYPVIKSHRYPFFPSHLEVRMCVHQDGIRMALLFHLVSYCWNSFTIQVTISFSLAKRLSRTFISNIFQTLLDIPGFFFPTQSRNHLQWTIKSSPAARTTISDPWNPKLHNSSAKFQSFISHKLKNLHSTRHTDSHPDFAN